MILGSLRKLDIIMMVHKLHKHITFIEYRVFVLLYTLFHHIRCENSDICASLFRLYFVLLFIHYIIMVPFFISIGFVKVNRLKMLEWTKIERKGKNKQTNWTNKITTKTIFTRNIENKKEKEKKLEYFLWNGFRFGYESAPTQIHYWA